MQLCKHAEKSTVFCRCVWYTAIAQCCREYRSKRHPQYQDRYGTSRYWSGKYMNKLAYHEIAFLNCFHWQYGSYAYVHQQIQNGNTCNGYKHTTGYISLRVNDLTP